VTTSLLFSEVGPGATLKLWLWVTECADSVYFQMCAPLRGSSAGKILQWESQIHVCSWSWVELSPVPWFYYQSDTWYVGKTCVTPQHPAPPGHCPPPPPRPLPVLGSPVVWGWGPICPVLHCPTTHTCRGSLNPKSLLLHLVYCCAHLSDSWEFPWEASNTKPCPSRTFEGLRLPPTWMQKATQTGHLRTEPGAPSSPPAQIFSCPLLAPASPARAPPLLTSPPLALTE
jgi:hypothetical protein